MSYTVSLNNSQVKQTRFVYNQHLSNPNINKANEIKTKLIKPNFML